MYLKRVVNDADWTTRVSTLKVYNDDGSEVDREVQQQVLWLMDTFKTARVNGPNTPVSHIQAMRMALAVLNSCQLNGYPVRLWIPDYDDDKDVRYTVTVYCNKRDAMVDEQVLAGTDPGRSDWGGWQAALAKHNAGCDGGWGQCSAEAHSYSEGWTDETPEEINS